MGSSRRRAPGRGSVIDVSTGKNGTKWLVRVSLGPDDARGRRPRLNKIIKGTKRDAERFLTEHLRRKDEGQPVALSRQPLEGWLHEWLTIWCNNVSDRTKQDYTNLVRRYITENPLAQVLRTRRLIDLSPSDIQALINGLQARGLSPRTIQMVHGVLRTALNQAVQLDKIARNPTSYVKTPKLVRREMKALTPEEASRFLDAAASDPHYTLFAVLLMGGLRPGEALALKWSDLEGSTLRVQRALTNVGNQLIEAPTKTGRGRAIPLPRFVVKELRQHKAKQAAVQLRQGRMYRDQGYIFTTSRGTPLSLRNLTSRHFKPILKRAGIRNLRLYDLRHSCATLLFADGVPAKVVQERLGHSSIALTLDTYTHLVPGMQEAASEKLDDRYGQASVL